MIILGSAIFKLPKAGSAELSIRDLRVLWIILRIAVVGLKKAYSVNALTLC